MNKGILFLLTFIPIIAGYLRNSLLFTPVLGIILFYVVPIAVFINFEPHPNQITQVSAMAMSVISLTVMIFVFALGVIYGKKHKKI